MNGLVSVVKVWRRRMWPSQRPRSPVISWTSLLFQACQHFLQRFQRLFSWKLHVWFVVGRELQAGYDPHNMFVQAWKNEKHWRGNQSADLFVKIWHLSPSFSLFYALKLNPKSVVAPSFWLEPLTRRGSHYWTVQNEMIREKWKRERERDWGESLSEGPIRKSLHESKSRVSDRERFREQEGQIRHVKTSVTLKDSRHGAVTVKGFSSR